MLAALAALPSSSDLLLRWRVAEGPLQNSDLWSREGSEIRLRAAPLPGPLSIRCEAKIMAFLALSGPWEYTSGLWFVVLVIGTPA